jgi:hypothetical protein
MCLASLLVLVGIIALAVFFTVRGVCRGCEPG